MRQVSRYLKITYIFKAAASELNICVGLGRNVISFVSCSWYFEKLPNQMNFTRPQNRSETTLKPEYINILS